MILFYKHWRGWCIKPVLVSNPHQERKPLFSTWLSLNLKLQSSISVGCELLTDGRHSESVIRAGRPMGTDSLSLGTNCRVPTQNAFLNSLCFPSFFPCPNANFPCANLRDLWLLHTQNWLIQFPPKLEIFAANIKISFTFRIREFPVFSLCFGKISKCPVFSLTGIFIGHFPFSLWSVLQLRNYNTPFLTKDSLRFCYLQIYSLLFSWIPKNSSLKSVSGGILCIA